MAQQYLSNPALILGNPLISSVAFYPRSCEKGSSSLENTIDGSVSVEDDNASLGYRLYPLPGESSGISPSAPLIMMFHGNGELAADYEDLVGPLFHAIGLFQFFFFLILNVEYLMLDIGWLSFIVCMHVCMYVCM